MTKFYKITILCLFMICFYLLFRKPRCWTTSNPEDSSNLQHPISRFKVVQTSGDLPLYLYSAVLDNRFNRTMIRIFALEPKKGVGVDFNCRWISNDPAMDTVIHEVRAQKYWIDTSWPNWSSHFAVEYTCPVPKSFSRPIIQLSSVDVKHVFNITVEYSKETAYRKDIAVCLKPQTGKLEPTRLIEWFEMLRLVGINDVIAYTTDITGSARFVIQYYEEQRIATQIPFPYLWSVLNKLEKANPQMTGEDRYALYQQMYLIGMHDCLYRFRGLYKHIMFIDTDEMFTPSNIDETVSDVLKRTSIKFPFAAGYLFFTAWHWEETGKATDSFIYMQRYAKATHPIDNQPKSILITDRVITINFHVVLDVPNTKLTSEIIPWESYGYVHHYRGKCANKFQPHICKNMLEQSRIDGVMPKYREKLETNTKIVLDQLQIT